MTINTTLRVLVTALILIISTGAALAQEPLLVSPSKTDTQIVEAREITLQPSVNQTGVATLGNQALVQPVTYSCACTNGGGVTVICESCDNADNYDCVDHDYACRDAAQMGGIREHNEFICTLVAD